MATVPSVLAKISISESPSSSPTGDLQGADTSPPPLAAGEGDGNSPGIRKGESEKSFNSTSLDPSSDIRTKTLRRGVSAARSWLGRLGRPPGLELGDQSANLAYAANWRKCVRRGGRHTPEHARRTVLVRSDRLGVAAVSVFRVSGASRRSECVDDSHLRAVRAFCYDGGERTINGY